MPRQHIYERSVITLLTLQISVKPILFDIDISYYMYLINIDKKTKMVIV